MFDIEYKGGNCIIISAKKSTVVIDPKLSVHGEKDIIYKGAIELATEDRFLTGSDEYKLNISYPGSYEISDFSINGFPEKRHLDAEGRKSTIYSIEVAGARIGVLGNIGPDLSDEQLENLGVLDILILPVGGGGYTLDSTSAANIVRRSDAKVIIPVNYGGDGIKYEIPQSDLSLFIKEVGADVEEVSKYKPKSLSSLPEKTTIIKIERSL